jgi:3-hydroxyacyl-CoA dehydrogenase
MARPPFSPDPDQRKILGRLSALAKRRAELDTETDETIAAADSSGIPIAAIAAAANMQRKTVYRHLGVPMR